jgi:hypothetical protein
MQKLVIEYLLDGEQRGYNFTTPTERIAPAVRRTVWRQAMPRGQGWGEAIYHQAHALKCIPLENGRVALSEVVVTDQQDEMGRQGIRRAEITLLRAPEYPDYLQQLYEQYPESIRKQAEAKFNFGLWKRIANQAMPKMKGQPQIILAYPYTTPADWQVIEAMVIKLATASRLRLMKGWGKVNAFTTLALDYRDESRIVALPLSVAESLQPIKGKTIITLD